METFTWNKIIVKTQALFITDEVQHLDILFFYSNIETGGSLHIPAQIACLNV